MNEKTTTRRVKPRIDETGLLGGLYHPGRRQNVDVVAWWRLVTSIIKWDPQQYLVCSSETLSILPINTPTTLSINSAPGSPSSLSQSNDQPTTVYAFIVWLIGTISLGRNRGGESGYMDGASRGLGELAQERTRKDQVRD